MANGVGDAVEGEAEVAAADIIAQADTIATGAAGIALSGHAARTIPIANALPVLLANTAAILAFEITSASATIEVVGALRGRNALPACAARAEAAHVATPAAMPIVGLGVDTIAAAGGPRSAGAGAIDAGEITAASPIALPAVRLVIGEIDALGPAQLAAAAASPAATLTPAAGAGLPCATGLTTPAAMLRIGLGVDACFAAFDRAVLALLLFLLLGLCSHVGYGAKSGGESQRGKQAATRLER